MNRLEAIEGIIDNLTGDELIIHANGAISRESFHCCDRKQNFYLLGSMGLASSVGLGVALNRVESRVVVLDGDGNVLMGLGNLALIGALKPSNLVHAVLDNGTYGTTGNQPTISPQVVLSQIATAAGYVTSHSVRTTRDLADVFRSISGKHGPHFVHITVSSDVPRKCPRIPYTASEIKDRFKTSLS